MATPAASNKGSDGFVTISGPSFESMAMGTPLPFTPPLSHLASDPGYFRTEWTLLQYVFEFEPPGDVPPFENPEVPREQEEVFRRYVGAASDLATSPFIAHPTSLSYEFDADKGLTVDTDCPHRENARGFSVLMRQFYSGRDAASLKNIVGPLAAINTEQASDRKTRARIIDHWERAERKLRRRPTREWVGLKLAREGALLDGQVPGMNLPAVAELIEYFNYGDLIHWGDKTEELADLLDTPAFAAAAAEFKFYEGITDLAHLYMGFAVVVDNLFGYGLTGQSA